MGSQWQTVRLEVGSRIARLTLNRPERRNAVNPAMLEELLQALDQVRQDREVNVLVITGAGKVFSAGVDLDTPFFMEHVESDSVYEGMRLLHWQHELVEALARLPQATIAMINGSAVGGGGFGLAMACDMRFAVRDARFSAIPMSIGVVQDFGLSWFLQRAVGTPRTMEIIMSGDPITAEQGEQWGFINRTFAGCEELEAHVNRLAVTIAAGQPDAVRMLKQAIRHGATNNLHDQLQMEAVANGLCFQSPEFLEAKRLFLQRLRKK